MVVTVSNSRASLLVTYVMFLLVNSLHGVINKIKNLVAAQLMHLTIYLTMSDVGNLFGITGFYLERYPSITISFLFPSFNCEGGQWSYHGQVKK